VRALVACLYNAMPVSDWCWSGSTWTWPLRCSQLLLQTCRLSRLLLVVHRCLHSAAVVCCVSLRPGMGYLEEGGFAPQNRLLSQSTQGCFVSETSSDDVWGSKGICRLVSRSIAAYLVKAWDVRYNCKHNGAVLPLSSGPGGGRGANGVDAMA
jgi:hypothetical protein